AQGFLVNSFADTVGAKFPMYLVRGFGGVLYLTGAIIMAYNLIQTIRGKEREEGDALYSPTIKPTAATPAE
ncbi:MAG: cytochrome-c oxidase, cbb3-type subunit I, partial [Pseudomonadota bacterium]